jgi:uncharacterized protein (TIGR02453 family)
LGTEQKIGDKPQERTHMDTKVDLQPILSFLKALETNNDREWFKAHRTEYDLARARFEEFVAVLIGELSHTEPLGNLDPKDCIFRIHRDLRFSKDKTPYKTHFGGYIAPGGRQSRRMGFYVHIEIGESMFAGGMHHPESKQLAAFRAAIDRDASAFKSIISEKSFQTTFGEVEGDKLKTMPRGYPKDHPEAELLRYKSIVAVRNITDDQVVSGDIVRLAVETHAAMKPFLSYLDAFD